MEQSVSARPELQPFLDAAICLTALPAKNKKRLLALYYLAEKIDGERDYTEMEINDLLNAWTAFHDPATLRRELYNKRLLNRTKDCSRYWKAENAGRSVSCGEHLTVLFAVWAVRSDRIWRFKPGLPGTEEPAPYLTARRQFVTVIFVSPCGESDFFQQNTESIHVVMFLRKSVSKYSSQYRQDKQNQKFNTKRY